MALPAQIKVEIDDRAEVQSPAQWQDAAATTGAPVDGGLRLGAAISRFTTAVQCWDLATTADGRLLLAAREHGLIECDARGMVLSSWSPAQGKRKDESTQAVDEVPDGRVAAGLMRAQTVLLLQRGAGATGSTWIVDQQVAGLQGWPARLSVHGELMAVAEGSARHRLVLVSVPSGCIRLRRELGYRVFCLTSTASAVVTASYGKVEGAATAAAVEARYVLESYSHSGHGLWRQLWDEQVCDVCLGPTDRLLYVALEDSDRVKAVAADDGRPLDDVLCLGSHGLKKPLRLSVSKGQKTVLAVLSGDAKTVTIYPVVRSLRLAGSKPSSG